MIGLVSPRCIIRLEGTTVLGWKKLCGGLEGKNGENFNRLIGENEISEGRRTLVAWKFYRMNGTICCRCFLKGCELLDR